MTKKQETNIKQYKAHLRIPTKEQYAYMEIETAGTAEEIVDDYHLFNLLYNRSLENPKLPPF